MAYVKQISSWVIELGAIDSEFEYCETTSIVPNNSGGWLGFFREQVLCYCVNIYVTCMHSDHYFSVSSCNPHL